MTVTYVHRVMVRRAIAIAIVSAIASTIASSIDSTIIGSGRTWPRRRYCQ
jgi:hypothetical protein